MDSVTDGMLNREQAAKRLGVSVSTLDRLRYAGKIEEVRISPHKIRFTEKILQEHARGRRRRNK